MTQAILNKPSTGIELLLGNTIHRIVGYRNRLCGKICYAQYILFSDKKTYIEITEQDYYTFHDASSSARELNVRCDERVWAILNEDKKLLDANQLNQLT